MSDLAARAHPTTRWRWISAWGVQPLIPGAGIAGGAYDGSSTQQWSLRANGSWASPPGGSGDGSRWFNGDGPPGTVSGAEPGDYYLDGISGAFYVLEN